MTSEQNRLAIVTRSPDTRWQTFVRRHIEHLNGGNTVVMLHKGKDAPFLGKPALKYRRSRLELFLRANGWPPAAPLEELLMGSRSELKGFFDQHSVSHVLTEFGYIAAELGPRLISTGRPVFTMFRGSDASSRLARPQYCKLLRQVVPRLGGIISVSQHLIDNLASHGIRHNRSIVVPSGTDTRLFVPMQAEPGLCVSVGRLVPKKSPGLLIKAFAKVAERHNLRLELIGDGEDMAATQALAASMGLAERVQFTGYLPHDEVVRRMRRAMIYVQHFQTAPNGDTEGMPNVIQEAMACGLPIVTTRHAGIPDHIVNGENGLLVDEGDVEGFARALDLLAGDPDMMGRFGEQARRYALANLDYRICHDRIAAFMGL